MQKVSARWPTLSTASRSSLGSSGGGDPVQGCDTKCAGSSSARLRGAGPVGKADGGSDGADQALQWSQLPRLLGLRLRRSLKVSRSNSEQVPSSTGLNGRAPVSSCWQPSIKASSAWRRPSRKLGEVLSTRGARGDRCGLVIGRRQLHRRPEVTPEGGLSASASDLMIGLLFVFIILVVVLALEQKERQGAGNRD